MLLDNIRNKEEIFIPLYNTGTIADIWTGKFIPGINNKMYLNGGVPSSIVIGGTVQTFKSTTAGSLLARLLTNYPEAEAYTYETELNVQGPERYDDFVAANKPPVSPRITFLNISTCSLDEHFKNVQEICKEKEKNKKDLIVDSPFLNPKTMRPYKVWIPTFILSDSWSNATSNSVNEKYNEEKSVDDSGMNLLFMQDGMVKTRINRAIPTLAARYGLYFITTAHIDEQINLNPREHPTKILQYMKQTHRFKNVGGSFEFLASTLLQTINATALVDSSKTGGYYPPSDGTNCMMNEVSEVNTMLVKCKNNAAGIPLPLVVSQYQGLLDEVTNFHYIRKMSDPYKKDTKGLPIKEYGIKNPGARSLNMTLYPDKAISRNNIRKVIEESYEVCRALELTTQLCFIQNNWFTANLPSYINIPIDQFAEKLNKDKSVIKGVLNSTGIWSLGKSEREYMSIFDVAKLVSEIK